MTSDGRPVSVVDPGKRNVDGGPDFKHATVRIGNTLYVGDVEIHRSAKEWTAHAHDRDPNYNRVILHAVLTGGSRSNATESGRIVPELIIGEYLHEVPARAWKNIYESDQGLGNQRILCSGRNDGVDRLVIERWVLALAHQRLQLKVRKFHERLKQLIDGSWSVVHEPHRRYVGDPKEVPDFSTEYTRHDYAREELWNQVLYEGILEGLGYSKNRQPLERLARNVTLRFLRNQTEAAPPEEQLKLIQGILFGVAGLLPAIWTAHDRDSRSLLRDLRKRWKQTRPTYKGPIMHRADWQFFRLRPQNFPTPRLAAASLLALRFLRGGPLKATVSIVKNQSIDSRRKLQLFHEMLSVEADDFWSTHYTFYRRSEERIHNLVGVDRANDIIVNTVVPVCLLYARIFRDREVQAVAMDLLRHLSGMSGNALTRLMDRELLRGNVDTGVAMVQQGVIQLYTFYCTEGRCSECAVGQRTIAKP